MIAGIIFLSMSQLSIDMASYDILEQGFLIRITIFTVLFLGTILLLTIFTKKTEGSKVKGVLLAITGGMFNSLIPPVPRFSLRAGKPSLS